MIQLYTKFSLCLHYLLYPIDPTQEFFFSMTSSIDNIDESKVISFVRTPALLLHFSEYVLAKPNIVEKFVIEQNDENVDIIFLLLLIKAFVEFKKGCSCLVAEIMLGCAQFDDKTVKEQSFFTGKEGYISEHLLGNIAKEFFLNSNSAAENRGYSNFVDFFEDACKETSKFLAIFETKRVVVTVFLGVLIALSKRQSPEVIIEKRDTSEAVKKLHEFYDAIAEELSFEEFYFFYRYCILRGLSPIALPVKIKKIAKSVPLIGSLLACVKRAVLWFRRFT